MKGYARRLVQKIFRISLLFVLRIVEEALFWQCSTGAEERQEQQHNKQSVRKLDALLFIYH